MWSQNFDTLWDTFLLPGFPNKSGPTGETKYPPPVLSYTYNPDYSAGKQENVCSFPQTFDMVKKIKQS
jgi:hypothetical protein